MLDQIATLRQNAESEITSVDSAAALEAFRGKYLVRKGAIAELFEQLKSLPPAEKPTVGKALNELRTRVQGLYDARAAELQKGPAAKAQLDLTLPGRRGFSGSRHPLMQTLDEMKSI